MIPAGINMPGLSDLGLSSSATAAANPYVTSDGNLSFNYGQSAWLQWIAIGLSVTAIGLVLLKRGN